jgi:putative solute:sodium symporter small subunit
MEPVDPKPLMTREAYWRRQIQRILILLAVWAIVGFILPIFLAEPLNAINFGGIPFGFWMAQQGSIFVFVSLVWIYAYFSDRADREAGLHEAEGTTAGPGAGH